MSTNRLEAQPASYGQLIELPDRDLGAATVFGWVVIVFGAIGVLFMLGWIGGPAAFGIGMVFQGHWFGYLFFAFGMLGLGGLFMSAKLLAAGVAILRNRVGCEIRITDKEVISREKFGWFTHSIKVDRAKIESLFLRPLLIDEFRDEADKVAQIDWITRRLPENWHGIATQARKGQLIAAGYPPETLLPLADLIKDELDRNRVGLVSVVNHTEDSESSEETRAIQQPVSIVRQSAEEHEAVLVELPADSSIEIVEQRDATVYRIPEKGIWKGSHGLMIFAVVWNVFLAIITATIFVGNGNVESDLWIVVTVLSLFWAVGIGFVIGAFYLGRQSALIGVRDGLLFIERKTIFGTKWSNFEPGDVVSIHIGAGNMEVNEEPVMELKIQPVGEAAIGMFSQLDDGEICWLAQQLSNELNLKPNSPTSWQQLLDPDQPLAPPETSQVKVDQSANQTLIVVPKKKIEGHWTLVVMGLALALGSLPIAIYCTWNFGADLFVIPIALIGTMTGIAMLVVDRLYSTRWFRLDVTDSQIAIERHGFLSERVGSIAKEDIKGVVLKDSGTKVNGRTLMHLSIESRQRSETFTLMSGRDEREIAYVAALIHQTMSLSENSPVA